MRIREVNAKSFPEVPKNLLVAVDQLRRRDSQLLGSAFDIYAMLVGAGDKCNVVAAHALVARDDVADDRGVGGAYVRPRVSVIDRRGEIEFRLRHRVAPANPMRGTTDEH